MHATLTLQLPSQLIATLRQQLNRDSKAPSLAEWVKLIRAVAGGADMHRGMVRTVLASNCAAGYYDCDQSSAVDDTDMATVAGVALAVVAAPASTAQFAKGDTDAEFASNLADCINNNATLQKLVRAYAVADRCHVVAILPGPQGNFLTLAETGDGLTRSAATLANGACDAPEAYQCGYAPGATPT